MPVRRHPPCLSTGTNVWVTEDECQRWGACSFSSLLVTLRAQEEGEATSSQADTTVSPAAADAPLQRAYEALCQVLKAKDKQALLVQLKSGDPVSYSREILTCRARCWTAHCVCVQIYSIGVKPQDHYLPLPDSSNTEKLPKGVSSIIEVELRPDPEMDSDTIERRKKVVKVLQLYR